MKILDVATMQALDQKTIDLGLPSMVLMERAALGMRDALLKRYPEDLSLVCLLSGSGNNGGDALALARLLALQGYATQVLFLGDPEHSSPDNHAQYQLCRALDIPMVLIQNPQKAQPFLKAASLIVDGLFGVGLSRPVEGHYAAIIQDANAQPVPRVALDIPSGLDGNTGVVLGVAFEAHLTLTCGYYKQGLWMDPALAYVGDLGVVDIGIPPAFARHIKTALITPEILDIEPQRAQSTHKGSYGRLTLLAGSMGMSGAAVLATEAALRSGVGLVTVCVPESIQAQVASQVPEAMVYPLPDDPQAAYVQMVPFLEKSQTLLVGPGLGQNAFSQGLLDILLQEISVPLVLDADGLNGYVQNPQTLKTPTVLTPHVGEMGRLMGIGSQEVQADRLGVVQKAAEKYGATVLLKGARTLIATDKHSWVNPTGNPVLARGGSGDVLAGLIAGLMAQGKSPENSAVLATYWHGLAADLFANEQNGVTMTLRSLISYLNFAYSKILKSKFGSIQ